MRVLITSIGSNTAISFIKALRLVEENFEIYGIDNNEQSECAGFSFVDHFFKIPLVYNKVDYEKQLINIIEHNKIDCVVPIHDLEIEFHAELSRKYKDLVFWAVNSTEIIHLCNDKIQATSMAKNLGLKVPKVYSKSDLPEKFPVIAKPKNGVSSRGIMKISSTNELDQFSGTYKFEDYIVQDFIEGLEYTIDCYSTYEGVFFGGIPRKRIETKAGISTKGVTVRNERLIELCKHFLNTMKFKGACNMQFMKCGDEYYFIEINPRFAGGGILGYRAGLNAPYFTLLEASGAELPSINSLDLKYNMKMVRYWEEDFYEV